MPDGSFKALLFVLALFFSLYGLVYLHVLVFNDVTFYGAFNIVKSYDVNHWGKISTSYFSAVGIALGYLFIKYKMKYDAVMANSSRKRSRLNYLYEEMCRVDNKVKRILKLDVNGELELLVLRREIEESLYIINDFLEENERLLGFSENELVTIMAVGSAIFNEKHIMSFPIEEVISHDFSAEKSSYIELMQKSRSTFLQKMEAMN